jgi:hypothetical protein
MALFQLRWWVFNGFLGFLGGGNGQGLECPRFGNDGRIGIHQTRELIQVTRGLGIGSPREIAKIQQTRASPETRVAKVMIPTVKRELVTGKRYLREG